MRLCYDKGEFMAFTGWNDRLHHCGACAETIEEIASSMEGLCDKKEKEAMEFLYETLPLSDIGDYPFDLFLEYVRHSLEVREKYEWCRELPRNDFFRYVLYPRINSEKLVSCRSFFYEKVKDIIEGKDATEAVIALNYWCSSRVTYMFTDERTMDPIGVYETGHGRCGEESTFFVSVLRSCGFAARQIYVPWWSHCDDNHAWVEVKLHDGWHYMGACEPEEVLDLGWFSGPASRGMLVTTRNFGFTDCNPSLITGRRGTAIIENVTSEYSDTVKTEIIVTDEAGKAISNALVHIYVLNFARYMEIALAKTDEEGRASFITGKGSIYINCSLDKDSTRLFAEKWLDTSVPSGENERLVLKPAAESFTRTFYEYKAVAPAEKIKKVRFATPEEKRKGKLKKEEALGIREAKFKRIAKEQKEREKYFTDTAKRAVLWNLLCDKDKRDIKDEMFDDFLADIERYEGVADDITLKYVFAPRIRNEQLSPYKSELKKVLGKDRLDTFKARPVKAAEFVRKNVRIEDKENYPVIVSTPAGTLRAGCGTKDSMRTLLAAILRTCGIPARIDAVTGTAQYFDGNAFMSLEDELFGCERAEKKVQSGKATLIISTDRKVNYGTDFTINHFNGDNFLTLRYDESGESVIDEKLSLSAGIYRIITTLRNPNGSQNLIEETFFLKEGEVKNLSLRFAKSNLAEAVLDGEYEDFDVTFEDGLVSAFSEIAKGRKLITAFVVPAEEPTEHVLNELTDRIEEVLDSEAGLLILTGTRKELETPKIKKLLCAGKEKGYLGATCEMDDILSSLGRRLYVDPDKRPVLMLTGKDGKTVFGESGYRVGSVDMFLKLIDIQ